MELNKEIVFDPADMAAAGYALYGERWQSELAHNLGVDPRRVRQWMAGERKPKVGVMLDIIALMENNQRELAAVKRKLLRRYRVEHTGNKE